MVSVPHAKKHLIKFPIDLDYVKLKKGASGLRNSMENSTDSTVGAAGPKSGPGPQKSVLLKVDAGADVNLINKQTFDQLFGDSTKLLPTPV